MRLLVTGRLVSPVEPLLDELRLRGKVHLLGGYAQRDAPGVFRRAHLLLHTKVKDPCPTLVVEAMACGLPVVHPASGGTVELVGDEGGIGVPHPDTWEKDEPPGPEAMADAVERVLSNLPAYAAAARARAVERFSLEPWLERHRSCSSRSLRGSPRRARAASQHGSERARGHRARATRRRHPPAGRACARGPAAGSGACATGSRCSRRPGGRSASRPRRPRGGRRARGRTRSTAPAAALAGGSRSPPRVPRGARAETEPLVEAAYPEDDVASDEDREGNRPVPHVVAVELRSSLFHDAEERPSRDSARPVSASRPGRSRRRLATRSSRSSG